MPSKIHPDIDESHPFPNRAFGEDIGAERGNPNHSIRLDGLDETAIEDWWRASGLTRDEMMLEGPLLPWRTRTQNCSTVVARALRLGGATTLRVE
jgi:hypothetical protein